MDSEYVAKVREWVALDNLLAERREETREAQEKRRDLEDEIVAHVEKRGLDKLSINISDGLLRFSRRNINQSLSMRGVRTLLEAYAAEHAGAGLDVEEIMKFVQEHAPAKNKLVMTRVVKPSAGPAAAGSGGSPTGLTPRG